MVSLTFILFKQCSLSAGFPLATSKPLDSTCSHIKRNQVGLLGLHALYNYARENTVHHVKCTPIQSRTLSSLFLCTCCYILYSSDILACCWSVAEVFNLRWELSPLDVIGISWVVISEALVPSQSSVIVSCNNWTSYTDRHMQMQTQNNYVTVTMLHIHQGEI